LSYTEKSAKRDALETVALFLLLVAIFYCLGYWLIFRLERATPLMLSVAVATIATCLIKKRRLADLGWEWGEHRMQWVSYLLPLSIVLIAYLLIWISGAGEWYNTDFVETKKNEYSLENWSDLSLIVFHFVLMATYSFVLSLPAAFGEELGWRGFLVPELAKAMPFLSVALVSGLIWSLFHWPLMFVGMYGNDNIPMLYQVMVFSVFIVSLSVVMTYLRYKTNSLWTAVLFHASLNVFMQKVFTPLTIENSSSGWYVNEFGLIPAGVAALFAVYFGIKGINEFS